MKQDSNRTPFRPENHYKSVDFQRFETVLSLTLDERVDADEVLEYIIPALCDLRLLDSNTEWVASRFGNTLIISKPVVYLDTKDYDARN